MSGYIGKLNNQLNDWAIFQTSERMRHRDLGYGVMIFDVTEKCLTEMNMISNKLVTIHGKLLDDGDGFETVFFFEIANSYSEAIEEVSNITPIRLQC